MWEDFKSEWNKSKLWEKIILLLFYPLGVLLGLLFAIFWNAYGTVILFGIGVCLIDDTIPSQEVVGIASALSLMVYIFKFFSKKNK